MKKLISGLGFIALVSSSSVFADGHHGGGHWVHGHDGSGWMWVVPAIVGGAIVYEATRQPPQTIIIQQPVEPNCSPWTEIQNPDGTITRTRTCNK